MRIAVFVFLFSVLGTCNDAKIDSVEGDQGPDLSQDIESDSTGSIRTHLSEQLDVTDYLIEPGGVGNVKVGMDSTAVYVLNPDREIRHTSYFDVLSDTHRSFLRVYVDSFRYLSVELLDGKVHNLRISDSIFKTSEGIGVGSSFRMLKNTYPDYEIVEGEEMGPPFFVTGFGLSFELALTEKWLRSEGRNQPEDLLDENTLVTEVLIWK